MLRKVLPRTSFEQQLPDGWWLSRLYKGNRILYYNDIRVVSLPDDFNIEQSVKNVIDNPPEMIQEMLYQDGRLAVTDLSSKIQRRLIRKGILPYELVNSDIDNIIPAVAEYDGKTYTHSNYRWYDINGNCINSLCRFLSVWDARVKYAQNACTIADVARYSWKAVLECLGDDHQRFINNVLQPKLATNRKGWVWEAKFKKQERLSENSPWAGSEWDSSEEIEQEYRDDVNSCLHHYFFESIEHQVQMFTEDCNVPAFHGIKQRVAEYEADIFEQLKDIKPELSSFRWNSLMKYHEPVFAPKPMSSRKQADFYRLVHDVIVGQISGHQAALMFSCSDWDSIARESNRYEKHLTQHVPFYTDRWEKLSSKEVSFTSAVRYVISNVRDLITMGYRPEEKMIASFSYDDCRFAVHIVTGEVRYIGVAKSKYMSDTWLELKPEQRRARLNDDEEWEYQEKSIKKYNRLFSYLFNIVHKHWNRAEYFLKDKLTARKKYLRPSSRFLDKMKEKADNYIKSLERGVVVC